MDADQAKDVQRACAGEYPAWQVIAEAFEVRARECMRGAAIPSEVSSRAKSVPSLARKLIFEKESADLGSVRDRAGIRVVVHSPDDRGRARDCIRAEFGSDVIAEEDKSERLTADQLGYLGVHFDVLVPDVAGVDRAELAEPVVCEVQLKTAAEHAWAALSHALTYKAIADVPDHVKRQINRLVALAEVFDAEARQAARTLAEDPALRSARLLQLTERYFFSITGHHYDEALSLEMIESLMPLYSEDELERLDDILRDFVEEHRALLTHVYEDYAPDFVPLAFQPEALVIWERLMNDADATREQWLTTMPSAALEELANLIGVGLY